MLYFYTIPGQSTNGLIHKLESLFFLFLFVNVNSNWVSGKLKTSATIFLLRKRISDHNYLSKIFTKSLRVANKLHSIIFEKSNCCAFYFYKAKKELYTSFIESVAKNSPSNQTLLLRDNTCFKL